MSGPITCGFILAHALIELAALAIVESRAMKGEYDAVLARLRERDREIESLREQRQAARVERLAAMHRRAELQQGRIARMSALAQSLGLQAPSPPATPSAVQDDNQWHAYFEALDDAARTLEATLQQSTHEQADRLREQLAQTHRAPTIDEVLSAYASQRALAPGLSANETATLQQTVARVLGRLELPPGEPLPSELEALARRIMLAASLDHGEALTSELRLAVQRAREAREVRARDANIARKLLDELGDVAPEVLIYALERVVAGITPLDEGLRKEVHRLLDIAAADREQAESKAAALVLEQSLRDLGYEVEDIDATLFVDGGTVNFRRPGWERYCVRMRVSARERTVNFNVVRARGDEENAERRRLDALAEDRWCAEFPALTRTLAARGLQLDVTRRLEAGELPVQVVDPSSVPAVRDDEQSQSAAPALKQRPIG